MPEVHSREEYQLGKRIYELRAMKKVARSGFETIASQLQFMKPGYSEIKMIAMEDKEEKEIGTIIERSGEEGRRFYVTYKHTHGALLPTWIRYDYDSATGHYAWEPSAIDVARGVDVVEATRQLSTYYLLPKYPEEQQPAT